jgi:hypothetical protein
MAAAKFLPLVIQNSLRTLRVSIREKMRRQNRTAAFAAGSVENLII